jgi:hypothetical protein
MIMNARMRHMPGRSDGIQRIYLAAGALARIAVANIAYARLMKAVKSLASTGSGHASAARRGA